MLYIAVGYIWFAEILVNKLLKLQNFAEPVPELF